MKQEISLFWFRRDLRIEDNCALFHALNSEFQVLPIFIFDEEILAELPKNDPRVQFIYQTIQKINTELNALNASIYVKKGTVKAVFNEILETFEVKKIFFNKDYEPYALNRDATVTAFFKSRGVAVHTFKDQVIFEESEIMKDDGSPYTVFTSFKNKWLLKYAEGKIAEYLTKKLIENFLKLTFKFPSYSEIGFRENEINVLPMNFKCIESYSLNRDLPSKDTSNLSVHLRFGTVSIRKLLKYAIKKDATFTSELIWREFFMQILYHFPKVVHENFKPKYNFIQWRNNLDEFKLWCEGETGYPIVDAGMRQLNKTGYMHNRVRMITASFLTKHLLIDWRWGEAYFAEKLLDFELSSNNGNWQWVAGTGCDAAPYFRVFNPTIQQEKFDPNFEYIKKWNPTYLETIPIVEHKFARDRYLVALKKALQRT